ncbi:TrmH family RNA methyltransferase [Leeuwenhoekiella aequorea]|uniref:SpoU rRNA methylase family protein n=1 Tax=Leeuwenhoekiella aequorea TaxID=283736 RepID=A0A4Q0PAP0_9FLAO|nr:TrmH family RNA methyltransferase [Leeuwenhoekiella aequorea]RXG23833.1 SpoU rRNA methylase family protein [Leeuwenhoekiella aequorea]
MKTKQLSHENTQIEPNTFHLVLVCDGITSPANAGGLMRLSDALGIYHVYFCNSKINFESSRFKRTARSTEMYVPYTQTLDTQALLENLVATNYKLIGLELTNTSLPLTAYKTGENTKIALVLGNERNGISQEVLDKLNDTVFIPMHGKNSSMNVAQAAAIAAYNLINNAL